MIVLAMVCGMLGGDLWAEVEKKMATNRKRKWKIGADGCGYHVKEPAS